MSPAHMIERIKTKLWQQIIRKNYQQKFITKLGNLLRIPPGKDQYGSEPDNSRFLQPCIKELNCHKFLSYKIYWGKSI